MNWSLAIDFGTSNTTAAIAFDGEPPRSVRLSEQSDQMPSAVIWQPGEPVVGTAAVRSARVYPELYVESPKSHLDEGWIMLNGTDVDVRDIVAAVFSKVLISARRVAGGSDPSRIVLTHPEHWQESRQAALLEAARRAGLDPARTSLLAEPVAALLHYSRRDQVDLKSDSLIGVFDFGGGTCDISVLKVNAEGQPAQVLASSGVAVGGDDLDRTLLEWVYRELDARGKQQLRQALTPAARLSLREQVREAKHHLSEFSSAVIPVISGADEERITLTQAEFEDLILPDVQQVVRACAHTIDRAGVAPSDLHSLFLTGGSTHLKPIHAALTALLGRPPATLDDPKLVVALGAIAVSTPPDVVHMTAPSARGAAILTGRARVPEPASPTEPETAMVEETTFSAPDLTQRPEDSIKARQPDASWAAWASEEPERPPEPRHPAQASGAADAPASRQHMEPPEPPSEPLKWWQRDQLIPWALVGLAALATLTTLLPYFSHRDVDITGTGTLKDSSSSTTGAWANFALLLGAGALVTLVGAALIRKRRERAGAIVMVVGILPQVVVTLYVAANVLLRNEFDPAKPGVGALAAFLIVHASVGLAWTWVARRRSTGQLTGLRVPRWVAGMIALDGLIVAILVVHSFVAEEPTAWVALTAISVIGVELVFWCAFAALRHGQTPASSWVGGVGGLGFLVSHAGLMLVNHNFDTLRVEFWAASGALSLVCLIVFIISVRDEQAVSETRDAKVLVAS